jgi:hypothetical protein
MVFSCRQFCIRHRYPFRHFHRVTSHTSRHHTYHPHLNHFTSKPTHSYDNQLSWPSNHLRKGASGVNHNLQSHFRRCFHLSNEGTATMWGNMKQRLSGSVTCIHYSFIFILRLIEIITMFSFCFLGTKHSLMLDTYRDGRMDEGECIIQQRQRQSTHIQNIIVCLTTPRRTYIPNPFNSGVPYNIPTKLQVSQPTNQPGTTRSGSGSVLNRPSFTPVRRVGFAPFQVPWNLEPSLPVPEPGRDYCAAWRTGTGPG